jgi:hypothetical protein
MSGNNGTFLEELEILYHGRDVPFRHAEMWIMCFSHLINICCQHVIRSLTNLDLQDDDTADELLLNASAIQVAASNDPIAKACQLVRAMRASDQRKEMFKQVIDDGNERGWFKAADGKVIQLKPLELLHDVRTRWDSVYEMVCRLRAMCPVHQSYAVYRLLH